jgi:hypothetical protein
MLEHETESILKTLGGRTIGDRDSVLLREILAADIPRGIKTYIQAETVRSLETELFALPQFSRVDREAAGVHRHARAFIAAMCALYRFPREEYFALLENAVHFLENYLCRPQWTIENFIFESGGRMSAQDVIAKLECTVDYAYFRTLIQKILQRRAARNVSPEEFRSMLVRIDDQIVKQHNARELALLAKPIFDFLLLRDTPPDISIPLKPILVFFEDKKMNILRDYIESISRIRQRTEITLDELTTLVEDLYLGQAAPPVPPPPAPAAQIEPQAVEAAIPEEDSDVTEEPASAVTPEPEELPSPEEFRSYETTIEIQAPSFFDFVTEEPDGRDDGPLPEEPRPQRTPPLPPSAPAPEAPHAPPEAPPSAPDATRPAPEPPTSAPDATRPAPIAPPSAPEAPRPAPRAAQTRAPEKSRAPESYERLFASSEPPAALTDLREIIQGHDRTRFVKRLFDRDEDTYEDTISSLNNSGSWRDAAFILNSLYIAKGLDPFDPDVVEFTDAIHRRYLDAEKDGA